VTAVKRLWAPLALAIVLIALARDAWNRYEPIGIDFHTYEAAARVGLQRGWSFIYDQNLVAIEQKSLVPSQIAQPFLSPPTDAWLVAPLTLLPYWAAYYTWAAVTLLVFAAALVWAARSQGLARWIAVAAALGPWWVLHAVNLGQVAPLVAAGVVLTVRLARERRDLVAGLALSLIFLKPNTAFLVPFALLVAGRYRTFATWAAVGAAIAVVAFVTMGAHGISAYIGQLTQPLPGGASSLTLEGAFGVAGIWATGLRLVIAAGSLAIAFRLRSSPGLAIAAGAIGSLLVVPYLHGSDLCVLSAAAWAVWEERPAWLWRVPLAAGWLIASPYVNLTNFALGLNRWPIVEGALLAGLAVAALRPGPEGAANLMDKPELRARGLA
jgi:hypothetical protein